MNCLSLKIENVTTNSSFNIQKIKQFLTLMEAKFQQYSDFRYQASGLFSLVLLAKKYQHEDVALKVIECHDHTSSKIEGMKREHAIQKLLPRSHYMLEIYDQFFLSENEDRLEQSSDSSLTSKRYFVQEMQLCHGSLSGLLESFRQEKYDPSENLKETLAIQMLDAVNLLHSKQMAHRNIKPESFLISYDQDNSPIIKLRNLGLSSPNYSQNSTHSLPPNRQPETEVQSIEQDLFFLRLVFLQLDNVQTTFDYQLLTIEELAGFQEGQILPNCQLNRSSLLYEVACKILSKSDKNRESTSSLLLFLFNKSSEASQRTPLFSVVCRNSIDTICWSTPQMKLDHLKVLRKGAKPAQLNELMNEFELNAREQKEKYLTADQLKNALRIMLDWKEFKEGYDVLGVGESGVYLGVENLKEQRESVLKLSLCSNQAQVDEEIEIMRICQTSPYIMKFYDCKYFDDTYHNRFVVYEMERCKYSLKQYLELQGIYGEYPNELKKFLMQQFLISVNFLHQNKILHRNITLDSLLIAENENGQIVVKLCNLHHSSKLLEPFTDEKMQSYEIFEKKYYPSLNCAMLKYNGENPLFFAPERWIIPYPTTYQTDYFAVGLCLLLLDNYMIFSEEKLAENFPQFLQPYGETELDEKFQIDTSSNIFRIASDLLSYSPKQRKQMNDIMRQYTQLSEQNSSTHTPLFEENNLNQKVILQIKDSKITSEFLQLLDKVSSLGNTFNLRSLSLDLKAISQGDSDISSLLVPLGNLINLSSISLNLQYNQIANAEKQPILSPLSGLVSLQNLSINLSNNLIGDIGAKYLITPLKDLVNLRRFYLNLDNNCISDQSGKSLLCPLSKAVNLLNLSLSINNNLIGDQSAQSILTPLANLQKLQSISLDFNICLIGDVGIQTLLYSLTDFLNLQSLSLELTFNSIIKRYIHIFRKSFKKLKYLRYYD